MLRFLIIYLFISTGTYAQKEALEIIQYKDSVNRSEIDKVYWFGKIGHAYLKKKDLDSAKKYYIKTLSTDFLEKNPDHKAYNFNNLGILYYSTGDGDSSIYYYTEAERIFKELNHFYEAASCNINLGIIHKDLGLYEKAVKHLISAVNFLKNTDKMRELSSCYNTLAIIYALQKDWTNALDYHKKSLQIRKNLNLENLIAASYNNIGIIFRSMDRPDSALYYYEKSLEIKNVMNDWKGSGTTMNNIGLLLLDQKRYNESEPYLLKALQVRSQHPDRPGKAITMNNLGVLYLQKEEYQKALRYINEAGLLIDSLGLLEELRINLETKLKLYDHFGWYKQALAISKHLISVKDSILNKDKAEALIEMQTKYDTEKKEQEITLLEQSQNLQYAELSLRKTWIFGLSITSSLLFIIGFLLVTQWRKERQRKEHNQILLKELHHRIKNNLQLLSSIFSLQSRTIQDPVTLEAVRSGENRVAVMALIHQKLYNKESGTIELSKYISELVVYLTEFSGYDPDGESLMMELQPVEMDADKVTSIGFIINELLTNVFKYAFPENEQPYVYIKTTVNKNKLTLTVEDNGKGFRNKENKKGLGLEIIETIGEQLKGNIIWETEGRVKFSISLNIK